MKALDTEYKGFRFRSRTEARWAVFMDAMGVQYEYEREAYDLDGLFYLPDFWLPQMKSHLEIKPERPTDDEEEKAVRLARITDSRVYILWGQPQYPDYLNRAENSESAYMFEWMTVEENGKTIEHAGWDCSYWWCECPHCGRCELQFNGRADRIHCGCPKSEHGDKGYNFDSDRLMSAYAKARGYRFEPSAHNA